MSPHTITRIQRQRLSALQIVLLASFLAVCGVGIVSSTAQSQKQDEREFEDKIPKHLPIKVTVKHPEKVKNLQNEDWVRDLEIEVENKSDKPIYHLLLFLDLPDTLTEDGYSLGFPLRYGRGELTDYFAPLEPDDVPIKPSETYTFRIPIDLQQGWEKFNKRRGLSKAAPKKCRLIFQLLNYGDGTGFHSTGGLPVDIHRKPPDSVCIGRERRGVLETYAPYKRPDSSDLLFQVTALFLPAKFLPVNFSLAPTPKPGSRASPTPLDDGCCPGSPCSHIKDLTVTCCGKEINKAGGAFCSDPVGFCGTYTTMNVSCNDQFGTYCVQDILDPCPSGPTPTPTPEPTPTPSGTPTPTPTPPPCPDESTKPNPSCYCIILPGGPGSGGIASWECVHCPSGQPEVDYPSYPQSNGCPSGYYNNGNNCCVRIVPPSCHGLGEDCSTGTCCGSYVCVDSTCQPPIDESCPQSCDPYQPLDSGGCYSAVDYCTWEFGCGYGFSDGGEGCCCGATPILIDVLGDGLRLTDAYNGVRFDMGGDGHREPVAWTLPNADDAWLALDRNGNGQIDSAKELFGNFTPQASPPTGRGKNGFLALAIYDEAATGGNRDGVIDRRDAVFSLLRLWQDTNHNGISEQSELHTLADLGLQSISLDYKEAKRTDEHGNQFRYRAKVRDVRGVQLGRWAWDAILKVNPPPAAP